MLTLKIPIFPRSGRHLPRGNFANAPEFHELGGREQRLRSFHTLIGLRRLFGFQPEAGLLTRPAKSNLERTGLTLNPNSEVGGDELAQDAEPIRLEEELAGSEDPASSDERLSRPADCARSPRSTSEFGLKSTQW